MAMPLYALTGKFRFNFQMNVPGSMQVTHTHTHRLKALTMKLNVAVQSTLKYNFKSIATTLKHC